jgi:16S rRNA (cytosine967-C5)-methyltransferase
MHIASPLLCHCPNQTAHAFASSVSGGSDQDVALSTYFEGGLDHTALDVDASRLQKVADNMQRLGYSANLQQGDASKPTGEWAEQTYDQILLDVPCSATGVMRRHPDIRILRRHSDIGELVKRQRLIMDAVWPLLKSGGKMLYATCSVLAQENELQVDAFLSRHNDVEVGALEYAGTASCTHGLQILPKDNVMDGFYYALLEKI